MIRCLHAVDALLLLQTKRILVIAFSLFLSILLLILRFDSIVAIDVRFMKRLRREEAHQTAI